MVDVGNKPWTRRRAVARGYVAGDLQKHLSAVHERSSNIAAQHQLDLASVLEAARTAGLDAARKTPQLIPLCHPLPPPELDIRFDVRPSGVAIEATAEVVAPTGVEMEALTACLFAALALTAVLGPTESISIDDVVLWEKTGGRSGRWLREQATSIR